MVLIFVYHILIPKSNQGKSREELYDFLKKKYPFGILENETCDNLEEILLDLFLNEILIDSELEDVRAEFQQFKFHIIVDNEEISLYKDDQDHERTVTESQIEQE